MRVVDCQSIRRLIGLDPAVAYTAASRLFQIIGSVGTVLLIIRFMSAVEQGYYYTLLSLSALQTIFELGFSFVILQLAAHESAHVTMGATGFVSGDLKAWSRLASVFQLSIRWYRHCALAFAIIVIPLGVAFFHRPGSRDSGVSWFCPWVATVFALSMVLFLTPWLSFMEGCGQVKEVAQVRMIQALAVFICSWIGIASGHGLYAPALVNVGWTAVGLAFFAKNLPLLHSLWSFQPREGIVSWRQEILPFQWRIAVTWICSYFTMQVFTPILFANKGPGAAGRMGLSLSIASCLQTLALAWITPKAAPFGRLVQLGKYSELKKIFIKTFWQSMGVLCGLMAACMAAVIGCERMCPRLAQRMESPLILALLFAGTMTVFAVQAMGLYLRSFKREPYLVQSLAVSTVMLGLVLWATPHWGVYAIAIIYWGVNAVLGLPWGVAIFHFSHKSRASLARA